MTIATTQDVRKISFEDYMASADEDSNTEWVRGEVVEVSPVSSRHQDVCKFLLFLIDEYAERNQLGKVQFDRFVMRLDSVPSAREPDILFVATEHLHRLNNTFVDGAADVVVEIVSLESRERDRGAKFYEYEQGGCRSIG